MTTEIDFEAAMTQLSTMRREVLALLMPLHFQLGFNVIENRLAPAPTIMLPPEDYAIFKSLVEVLPAPSNLASTTAPLVQPPHADEGGGTTSTCNKCGRSLPSAPGHVIHKCGQCSGGIMVRDKEDAKLICSADGCYRTEPCGPHCRDNGNFE